LKDNKQDNYEPFVVLKRYHLEANFGNDLKNKPFTYDISKHSVIDEFYEDSNSGDDSDSDDSDSGKFFKNIKGFKRNVNFEFILSKTKKYQKFNLRYHAADDANDGCGSYG